MTKKSAISSTTLRSRRTVAQLDQPTTRLKSSKGSKEKANSRVRQQQWWACDAVPISPHLHFDPFWEPKPSSRAHCPICIATGLEPWCLRKSTRWQQLRRSLDHTRYFPSTRVPASNIVRKYQATATSNKQQVFWTLWTLPSSSSI